MGPVLGGIGIGIVWGWLLVDVAAPAMNQPVATGLALGVASILLAAAVYGLAGWAALLALVAAALVGALIRIAIKADLEQTCKAHG